MYLLLESQLTKEQRKQIYFKGWKDFEPVTTDDLQEAHRFNDKEEAKLSAAYRYKQNSFVPVEVELAVKSKRAA